VRERVSRASETLLGLVMALTFTLSLAAAEAGRPVLIGMLSNAVAVAMLFLTCLTFRGPVGSPWRSGFLLDENLPGSRPPTWTRASVRRWLSWL
jgi:hypothetical protein